MPFNLKKLSERRAELLAKVENMVKTCETETRAFNEEEQTAYTEAFNEIRSIDATLNAAEQTESLKKTEIRSAGGEQAPSKEELEAAINEVL